MEINQTLSNLTNSELETFKSIFDYDEVRGAFSSSQQLQEDGTTKSESIKYHYIRTRNRWWSEIDIKELEEKVDKFNSLCESSKMVVGELTDEEREWDNDRIYPASFNFRIIPNKTK